MKIIYGHTSEETAKVIDNYPWGFKLKTQRRYWIETVAKKGDRFVFQTLDPRTNKWCKPKKSTYSDVMYMVEKDNGHISRGEISQYSDNIASRASKLELSELQQNKIDELLAFSKVMESVTFTCRAREFKHRETGEVTTSVPIMEMKDYYEVNEDGTPVDKENEAKQEQQQLDNINRGYQMELSKIKAAA